MRILIDLQSCQSGSRLGGIGRYSMSLAKAMLRNAGGHDLHFVLSGLMPEELDRIYSELDGLLPPNKIHVFDVPGPVVEENPKNRFRTCSAELIRENFIHSFRPDIVHVTSLIEGFGDNVTTSVGRSIPGDNTAVTLYDLIPLVDKERYLTTPLLERHYLRKIEDLRRASLLLSISEYSRREAMEELGVSGDIITNISSAVDGVFKPTKVLFEREHSLKKKYKIRDRFLMYTGSFDQRKNHEALIKAFSDIPQDTRNGLQLVIVGNGWEGIYSHLRWIASEAGLLPNDIIFAGKVSDEDLLDLYNLCFLFVFPSLSEGFGLPVLEAMSCGTPVIGSDSTSIPEVIGEKSALFDPRSIDSIANKLYQAITDENFRTFLSDHGLKQSKKFSWDISAKKVISAFERKCNSNSSRLYPVQTSSLIRSIVTLSSGGDAAERDLLEISKSIENIEKIQSDINKVSSFQRRKVGFVTTWNTRCGIAAYSEHLVDNLSVDTSILAPYSDELIKSDSPNVDRCWRTGEVDDLKRLALRVKVLEIETLVIQLNYGFFNFDFLSEFLHAQIDAGLIVLLTLHSTKDPGKLFPNKKLSKLSSALSRCQKLFVHTPDDIERLTAAGANNAELFPHGVMDYEPSKHSLKLLGGFTVASYGYFLPNKGLIELIEAIGIIRAEGVDVRLRMVNANYGVPESEELILAAERKISKLGLVESVEIITNYLTDESSLSLLSETDLIVFPYQRTGESSSAAVRYGLVTQRPVAVTPLEIFNDVASAVFTLPGCTSQDIAQGIRDIMQKVECCSEGVEAKQAEMRCWLEEHRYSSLGAKLDNILQQLHMERENESDDDFACS